MMLAYQKRRLWHWRVIHGWSVLRLRRRVVRLLIWIGLVLSVAITFRTTPTYASRVLCEVDRDLDSWGVWDEMKPPDIEGKNEMAGVESFIAANGWEMSSSPALAFAYGLGLKPGEQPRFVRDLPWKRLQGCVYPALTHNGILYVALDFMPRDVVGVAYNPGTNAFSTELTGFKPLADHWYVCRFAELERSVKLTKRYEGEE